MFGKKLTTGIAGSALIALALGAANPASALTTQLGILDLNANGGINPATGAAWQVGDTYRFIFATSTGTNALSSDITYYNNFAQDAANSSPLNQLASVNWNALVSTKTVDARDNTNTNAANDGPGESFWLLNGTSLVADNYADLYGSNTHSSVINIDDQLNAPFDGGDFTSVWTGSDSQGVKKSNAGGGVPGWLGVQNGVDNSDGRAHTGLWNFTSGAHWIDRFQVDANDEKGIYAVSEVLTIVPEPATGAMALVGLGALAMRRRRS